MPSKVSSCCSSGRSLCRSWLSTTDRRHRLRHCSSTLDVAGTRAHLEHLGVRAELSSPDPQDRRALALDPGFAAEVHSHLDPNLDADYALLLAALDELEPRQALSALATLRANAALHRRGSANALHPSPGRRRVPRHEPLQWLPARPSFGGGCGAPRYGLALAGCNELLSDRVASLLDAKGSAAICL